MTTTPLHQSAAVLRTQTLNACRLADAWRDYAAPAKDVPANPADVYRMAAGENMSSDTCLAEWTLVGQLAGVEWGADDMAVVLAMLEHDAPHRCKVREGISGRESNYVMECTCGKVAQFATHNVRIPAGRADEHEHLNVGEALSIFDQEMYQR